MLDHAREAVEFAAGKSPEQIAANRVLHLALTRLLEIVGEAASKVAREERDRYPAIPWANAVSLRNRLIHGYDTLDLAILSRTIKEELPLLIAELERALEGT